MPLPFVRILVVTAFIGILSACATSSAGLSTSTVPMADKKYTVLGPVEGMKYWITFDVAIIGIPLKSPPIDILLEELQKEKEADALINLRYWTDKYIFLFLTLNRLHISAEAVRFDGVVSNPVLPPEPKRKGR
ncbi:putative lipoprotein [Leptospira fainei serovar Hurstbridge str. BUT 6]|uniref:Lipoprotein n=1 Tax=Leptospira fainei serovar Hurstbridge str. BUT 6 TaxID=1193011 RepID=S3VWQ8_9LEPT|nr:lipoprotein [Leptospira fainei]EPG72547.1 putative lipoprotein [Leptospira fainei serovar Hurstbridge str. BUT 6]